MRLVFKHNIDENFIYSFLPKLMYSSAIKEIKKEKYKPMNKYLNKYYKYSLKNVVRDIFSNLYINKIDDSYTIELNPLMLFRDTNKSLKTMGNLVDYGNLNVQGVYLFSSIFQYVSKNTKFLYNVYLSKKHKER